MDNAASTQARVITEAKKALSRDIDGKRLQPLIEALNVMGDSQETTAGSANGQG